MKTCAFRPLAAALCIAFAAALFGLIGFGLVCLLAQPGRLPETEHQTFFLGACMLAFAGVCLIRRCLLLVRYRVEYDDFSLRFHFPDGAERVFSWHELPQKTAAAKVRAGWRLTFADDGRTYPLHRCAHGFRDLTGRLRESGVLP